MIKIKSKEIWLFVAQVLLLSFIVLSPGFISYISSGDGELALESTWIAFNWLAPSIGAYLLNFYLCIPLLWFRHRYW